MGRFWNTEKFEGKFGVGLQDSNDPQEYFGLDIEDVGEYGAEYVMRYSFTNVGHVLVKLKELYAHNGVPADRQRFVFADNEDLIKYVCDLNGYFFIKAYPSCCLEKNRVVHVSGMGASVEKQPGAELEQYRLQQGLAILNELLDGHDCIMDVEF